MCMRFTVFYRHPFCLLNLQISTNVKKIPASASSLALTQTALTFVVALLVTCCDLTRGHVQVNSKES